MANEIVKVNHESTVRRREAVSVVEFERHGIRHFRLTWREHGEACAMNLRQGGIMGKDEAVALIERRLQGQGELVAAYRPHKTHDDERD